MAISCNLLLNKLLISARASKSLFVTSHTPDPPMWSAMDWSESTLPGDSINGLVEKGTESLHLRCIHLSRRKHKEAFLAF